MTAYEDGAHTGPVVTHPRWCDRSLCNPMSHRSRIVVLRSRTGEQAAVSVQLMKVREHVDPHAETAVELTTDDCAIWVTFGQGRALRQVLRRLLDEAK